MPGSQSPFPSSEGWRELPRLDVVAVVVLTSLTFVLAAHFQLNEAMYAYTRRWEYLQLDEMPIGLLVLVTGLIWLSWRRYRQAERDLHARQRAEVQLAGVLAENRKLAQEYVRIEELERKQLARELHDELGQYLNAMKLDAVSVSEGRGVAPQLSNNAMLSIIRGIDHVQIVVSSIIGRLRPIGLDELGLVAAIEHCVDQWRQRLPAIRFVVTVRGDLNLLDESLTLTLYRVIQEGLTNIYKHAEARQVDITLEQIHSDRANMDEILLTVADNGRGSDTAAESARFGLKGMRERVEMAGGTFRFESAPGLGSSVEVRLFAARVQ
jgi:two-component system, NarL family, sensor histidine kinase UhpB